MIDIGLKPKAFCGVQKRKLIIIMIMQEAYGFGMNIYTIMIVT
jgi:hypothetical protein